LEISTEKVDVQNDNISSGITVMKGWDSKVGEDTVLECLSSDAFNAIVESNRTSKRAKEGPRVNPPERGGEDDICN
jgi:hypothetical protein